MKTVSVTIDGIDYKIVGDREEAQIVKIAKYIDKKLSEIRDLAPHLSKVDSTVLTSINIVDQLFENKERVEELEKELKSIKEGYSNTTEDVEKEFDSVLKKLEIAENKATESEKEIERLKSLIEEKEKEAIDKISSPTETVATDEEAEKKIKALEMKLKDMEKKVAVAESMATEFQNKAYNLQLNYEELKNKK